MTGDTGKVLKRSASCDCGDERGPGRSGVLLARPGVVGGRPDVLPGRGLIMAAAPLLWDSRRRQSQPPLAAEAAEAYCRFPATPFPARPCCQAC
jgi:hypothetical protein